MVMRLPAPTRGTVPARCGLALLLAAPFAGGQEAGSDLPQPGTIRDDNPVVRREAVEALGDSKRQAAVAPLLEALRDDNPEVRRKAATGLGGFTGPAVIEALVQALRDADSRVQWAAGAALGVIGRPAVPALAEALGSGETAVRSGAARALGEIDDAAARQALASAARMDRDGEVRREAVRALGNRGIAGDPLIQALADPDPAVQWEAAVALGRARREDSAAALIAALRDSEVGFRGRLADALVAIGPAAAAALVTALGDTDAAVQAGATDALLRIGPATVPAVIAGFRDENPGFRGALTEILAAFGQAALHPLIAALGDPAAAVRRGAAATLARMRAPEAVEPLLRALRDAEAPVRATAADALGATGDPKAAGPLAQALRDGDGGVRSQALAALVKLGPAAVDALLAALQDADWRVRWDALSGLRRIDGPRAQLAVTARTAEQAAVAAAYGERIGQGDPASEDPLVDALAAAGTPAMAEDFRNSGNAKLAEAARRWLEERGPGTPAEVQKKPGPRWGSRIRAGASEPGASRLPPRTKGMDQAAAEGSRRRVQDSNRGYP